MGNKEDTNDEPSTSTIRSKLSFSSTTSILSAEEQLEGDGPLTPIDKMEDDVVDDDDDDLSALNSILQAGSPGSLSEEEEDDLPTEQDSASPLSSVPEDFPLSPEIPPTTVNDDVLHEEEQEPVKSTSSRKRRKENTKSSTTQETKIDENGGRPIKKPKSSEESNHDDEHSRRDSHSSSQEDPPKKRRVSRSSLDIPETPRTRRRSRQEEKEVPKVEESAEKQQVDKIKQEVTPEKEVTAEMNGEPEEEEEVEEENQVETEENEGQDKNNQDYQQRHKEALDALTHIEIEFARLRDKMYQEKMSELNEEAMMIANGTHPELVSLMAEIEEKKGRRVHNAEAWRRHQHANFKQQFEGFEYQANIHFISQKNALRRTLLEGLNSKKWSIEGERAKLSDTTKETSDFPDGREIIVRKKENKEETNELQDIKELIGFPMAPNPSGLTLQDVDDDLKVLGLL